MLKYPCLVLDHDDTVVASEIAVNYPCFLEALEKFRPGEWMDHPEFVHWCFHHEFTDFLRIRYGMGSTIAVMLIVLCFVFALLINLAFKEEK